MVLSALARDVEAEQEADLESGSFLFRLEPSLQNELYAQGKIRRYKRGQLVLAKGTNSGLLYLLIKGRVKVTRCENERHLTDCQSFFKGVDKMPAKVPVVFLVPGSCIRSKILYRCLIHFENFADSSFQVHHLNIVVFARSLSACPVIIDKYAPVRGD